MRSDRSVRCTKRRHVDLLRVASNLMCR
ncbi:MULTISPECIES: putative leader peptide [Phycicoccus]